MAAFFTMLLLSVNLMVPAGAAAVSLYCDMDIAAYSMHNCCEDLEMDHHEKTESVDDCRMLSFCEQVVESEQSDIPAVLQHTKINFAADLTDEFDIPLSDDEDPEIFKDQSVNKKYSPPIFLLNSVFLN